MSRDAIPLGELEARFIRRVSPDGRTIGEANTIGEAEGVQFLCPKCFVANGGRVGTHMVMCWAPAVPVDSVLPGPGRWNLVGTGLEDLTLQAGSSSILLKGGCNWHGFVRNGQATVGT